MNQSGPFETLMPDGEALTSSWASVHRYLGHTLYYDVPLQWVDQSPAGERYLVTVLDLSSDYRYERRVYVPLPEHVQVSAVPEGHTNIERGALGLSEADAYAVFLAATQVVVEDVDASHVVAVRQLAMADLPVAYFPEPPDGWTGMPPHWEVA